VIVCRRPCTLYDVDVLGTLGLVALGIGAWWLVLAPWQQTWSEYRELSTRHAAAVTHLQQEIHELDRFEKELTQIEQVVASQSEQIPRATAISRLLREMTDIAKQSHLELLNVAPQPLADEGDYLVNDIEVTGRGSSHDLIRFLDRFALRNPHQALRACSITHPATAQDATCEVTWSVRLYLLPGESRSTEGAS